VDPDEEVDGDELDEALTSRQQTNSTVVSFVALLRRDDAPFDIEMIRKNTELPQRWIKDQRRASRILLIENDQSKWTILVGQWHNEQAVSCTWLDSAQCAD
jgi:hypothetical protein